MKIFTNTNSYCCVGWWSHGTWLKMGRLIKGGKIDWRWEDDARKAWRRCGALLKMTNFRSKLNVSHPVPVTGITASPLRSWCITCGKQSLSFIGSEKGARWDAKSRIGAIWGCWGIGGGGERQLHLYMLIAFVEKRVILVFPQIRNYGFLGNEFPLSTGLLDEPNKIFYG